MTRCTKLSAPALKRLLYGCFNDGQTCQAKCHVRCFERESTGLNPHLADIVTCISRVRLVLADTTLADFEADWEKQWLAQRGLEIISEASRRLSADIKARHPAIPWNKVAGIGNVLRHDYERVSAPIIWKLVREDLEPLEEACLLELQRLSK